MFATLFEKMCKSADKVLIILDGYDEAVDGQCRQLNDVLSSYGSKKKVGL